MRNTVGPWSYPFLCPFFRHAPLLSALLALVVTPAITLAHNGELAIATPVRGIVVDGVLDEWPADATEHSVLRAEFGDEPTGDSDLSCRLRIGFDSEVTALFVAVEVRDSEWILDPQSGNAWDTQDGCSIYLDRLHPRSHGAIEQYFRCGEELRTVGAGAHSDKVQVAMTRTEEGRVYEWRVPLENATANELVGFDVDVTDKDADGSFTWMGWGRGTRKAYISGRLGDVFLVAPKGAENIVNRRFGRVTGRILLDPSLPTGISFPQVTIQSQTNPRLWTQVDCDSGGVYDVELPAGSYAAHATDRMELRVDESSHVHFGVRAGQEVQAAVLHVRPLPKPDLIPTRGVLHNEALDAAEVDRFVQAYMDYCKIPGISIAIVKDGKLVYERGMGVKSLATGDAVQHKTLFEAASMTKPMFAFAVCRLVERDVLDLDTPLYKYLPNPDIDYDDRYKQITARMVLCHRTGFPNWRSGRLEIGFEPGTQQRYSGEGFEYLGKVVAHLTGKDLNAVMEDEVFRPLGIENAHLTWSNDSDSQLVAQPHSDGNVVMPKSTWSDPWVAGCLHIDAGNYAKFMVGLIEETGLSPAGHAEMLRPQVEIPSGSEDQNFGLGIVVDSTPFGPSYGHGGRNFGFTSFFEVFKDQKFGYAFLVNNHHAAQFREALRAFLVTGRASLEEGSAT